MHSSGLIIFPCLMTFFIRGGHLCPSNCKHCITGLADCERVDDLQSVLAALPKNITKILFKSGDVPKIDSQAFQRFTQLHLLSINGVSVSSLENESFAVAGESSLQILDLSNNRLMSCVVAASAFSGLVKLEHLYLYNNVLDGMKKSWFADMTWLKNLSLYQNRITYLPPRIFEMLSNLTQLDVSFNLIQYISTDTFFGLKDLTELDLSGNHIIFISDDALSPLHNLRKLMVNQNRLGTLSFLPESITSLHLYGNPWICTCKLVTLIQPLKNITEKPTDISCVGPKDDTSKIIWNTSRNEICTPPETPTCVTASNFSAFYGFLGGLFCALILCLVVLLILIHCKVFKLYLTKPVKPVQDTKVNTQRVHVQKGSSEDKTFSKMATASQMSHNHFLAKLRKGNNWKNELQSQRHQGHVDVPENAVGSKSKDMEKKERRTRCKTAPNLSLAVKTVSPDNESESNILHIVEKKRMETDGLETDDSSKMKYFETENPIHPVFPSSMADTSSYHSGYAIPKGEKDMTIASDDIPVISTLNETLNKQGNIHMNTYDMTTGSNPLTKKSKTWTTFNVEMNTSPLVNIQDDLNRRKNKQDVTNFLLKSNHTTVLPKESDIECWKSSTLAHSYGVADSKKEEETEAAVDDESVIYGYSDNNVSQYIDNKLATNNKNEDWSCKAFDSISSGSRGTDKDLSLEESRKSSGSNSANELGNEPHADDRKPPTFVATSGKCKIKDTDMKMEQNKSDDCESFIETLSLQSFTDYTDQKDFEVKDPDIDSNTASSRSAVKSNQVHPESDESAHNHIMEDIDWSDPEAVNQLLASISTENAFEEQAKDPSVTASPCASRQRKMKDFKDENTTHQTDITGNEAMSNLTTFSTSPNHSLEHYIQAEVKRQSVNYGVTKLTSCQTHYQNDIISETHERPFYEGKELLDNKSQKNLTVVTQANDCPGKIDGLSKYKEKNERMASSPDKYLITTHPSNTDKCNYLCTKADIFLEPKERPVKYEDDSSFQMYKAISKPPFFENTYSNGNIERELASPVIPQISGYNTLISEQSDNADRVCQTKDSERYTCSTVQKEKFLPMKISESSKETQDVAESHNDKETSEFTKNVKVYISDDYDPEVTVKAEINNQTNEMFKKHQTSQQVHVIDMICGKEKSPFITHITRHNQTSTTLQPWESCQDTDKRRDPPTQQKTADGMSCDKEKTIFTIDFTRDTQQNAAGHPLESYQNTDARKDRASEQKHVTDMSYDKEKSSLSNVYIRHNQKRTAGQPWESCQVKSEKRGQINNQEHTAGMSYDKEKTLCTLDLTTDNKQIAIDQSWENCQHKYNDTIALDVKENKADISIIIEPDLNQVTQAVKPLLSKDSTDSAVSIPFVNLQQFYTSSKGQEKSIATSSEAVPGYKYGPYGDDTLLFRTSRTKPSEHLCAQKTNSKKAKCFSAKIVPDPVNVNERVLFSSDDSAFSQKYVQKEHSLLMRNTSRYYKSAVHAHKPINSRRVTSAMSTLESHGKKENSFLPEMLKKTYHSVFSLPLNQKVLPKTCDNEQTVKSFGYSDYTVDSAADLSKYNKDKSFDSLSTDKAKRSAAAEVSQKAEIVTHFDKTECINSDSIGILPGRQSSSLFPEVSESQMLNIADMSVLSNLKYKKVSVLMTQKY